MWLLLDLTHQTDGKPAFIRKETATLSDSRNLTQLCSRVQEEYIFTVFDCLEALTMVYNVE